MAQHTKILTDSAADMAAGLTIPNPVSEVTSSFDYPSPTASNRTRGSPTSSRACRPLHRWVELAAPSLLPELHGKNYARIPGRDA